MDSLLESESDSLFFEKKKEMLEEFEEFHSLSHCRYFCSSGFTIVRFPNINLSPSSSYVPHVVLTSFNLLCTLFLQVIYTTKSEQDSEEIRLESGFYETKKLQKLVRKP